MALFRQVLFVTLLVLVASTPDRARGQELPPTPGPCCPASATEVASGTTFSSIDRFVAAYYFYWYRWDNACVGEICDPLYTRGHIEFATGVFGPSTRSALTHTPPDLESYDFADPEWHDSQIEDMVAAGIDVVLPVFWGVPGRYEGDQSHYCAAWSKVGLEALVKAVQSREEQGKPFPLIGMMYDTTTLIFESPFHYEQDRRTLDLRNDLGKKHFYATVRDFYSLVPPKYWARWQWHPLVWLYASEYAAAFDDTLLPDCKSRFEQEFAGATPWFVAHLDWLGAKPDWVYRWGGAIQPSFLSVNSLGPGFDRSGAEGKPAGSSVLRERAEGAFYRDAWEQALRSLAPVTVIETWNELHEGSEICRTREHGDRAIQITREYADRFAKGIAPPFPGPFAQENSVSWSAATGLPGGLSPTPWEDGRYRLVQSDSDSLIETEDSYLYFEVEDSFIFSLAGSATPTLEVEFFDLPARVGSLFVEYDSWDQGAQYHGIYKQTDQEPLSGKFSYRTVSFPLPAARFANNQNGGADLRLVAPKGLRVRSVTLRRQSP
jgi:hypothetical protein